MALATAGPEGAPSVRMVLLKDFGPRGFVFYTNYRSRKARELEANRRIALALYWAVLHRQVRIEGTVDRLSPEESDGYFGSRPRGAQLAAWASPQSAALPAREALESRFGELDRRFSHVDVPRPSWWGGFVVSPERFEFWQGRENRLHDRFLYSLEAGGGWAIQRLAP
jgi:pyridoxamine 5'-phosphate oxidase